MHPIPVLFDKAQALRGAFLRSRPIASVEAQLRDFLTGAEALGITRDHEQVWYRARLCEDNSRFTNLSQMLYPPEGSNSFGRAQYPGSKVLYASWNLPTALEEVGATRDDLVQVVRVRVRHPFELPCHVVGELQFFYSSGRSQIRSGPATEVLYKLQAQNAVEFLARVFIDSVVSDFFRAAVKRPQEYKLSAAYAELLHKGNGLLMYPSVETLGAMNLAVPAAVFDEKFEVLDTAVFRIHDYVGYGLFIMKDEGYSATFAQDGAIDWTNPTRVKSSRGPFGNDIVESAYVGWRKG